MTDSAIRSFRDTSGARLVLDALGINAELVPFDAGDEHCAIGVTPLGLWLLCERDGGTPAAIHDAYFTPFDSVEEIVFEMSDSARKSNDPAVRLAGLWLRVTQKDLKGHLGMRTVSGSEAADKAYRDGEAASFLAGIMKIVAFAVDAGVPASVSMGKA